MPGHLSPSALLARECRCGSSAWRWAVVPQVPRSRLLGYVKTLTTDVKSNFFPLTNSFTLLRLPKSSPPLCQKAIFSENLI